MGDIGDDDGGRGFAGVPVEVDEGAVAGCEVVVAVQDGAEDHESTEREDAEEDNFPGARFSRCINGILIERELWTFSMVVVP